MEEAHSLSTASKDDNPTLVVEFAGMPGSGKTTLCVEVTRRLREQGLPADLARTTWTGLPSRGTTNPSRYEKYIKPLVKSRLGIFSALMRSPSSAWFFFQVAMREQWWRLGREGFQRWKHYTLLLHRRRIQLRRFSKDPGIVLFDEGVFNNLVVKGYYSKQVDPAAVSREAEEIIGKPHLLVVLRIESTTVLERLATRERNGLGAGLMLSDHSLLPTRLHSLQTVAEVVQDLAKDRQDLTVLVIDNDQNIDRSVEEIASVITDAVVNAWRQLNPIPNDN